MNTFYRVENRENADDSWDFDDEFSSLGEAMEFVTGEALCHGSLEHRIVRWNAEEVLTIPRLGDHL
jgi:hypothetical protein